MPQVLKIVQRALFARGPLFRVRHGTFWMLQMVWDGWVSFGIHLDFKHRRDAWGNSFGPYMDLHLGIVILSLGWHPDKSTDLERVISVSRGGTFPDAEGTYH